MTKTDLKRSALGALLVAASATGIYFLLEEGEAPLHIDAFAVESITNFLGTPAKRLTFTVSGMETGSNYAYTAVNDLTDTNWFPYGTWTAASDTETHVRTNAQNPLQQDTVFIRIERF